MRGLDSVLVFVLRRRLDCSSHSFTDQWDMVGRECCHFLLIEISRLGNALAIFLRKLEALGGKPEQMPALDMHDDDSGLTVSRHLLSVLCTSPGHVLGFVQLFVLAIALALIAARRSKICIIVIPNALDFEGLIAGVDGL